MKEALADIRRTDPSIERFFGEAYGYAIFPSVGKGGLVVGGASGDGWVFEQGRLVGRSELGQLTVGAQAGGQSYAELIFFRDKAALDAFKTGDTELGAEVSAVALKSQASANAGYDKSGMAIFIMGKGGLMAEASVGGQKFDYEPLETSR